MDLNCVTSEKADLSKESWKEEKSIDSPSLLLSDNEPDSQSDTESICELDEEDAHATPRGKKVVWAFS